MRVIIAGSRSFTNYELLCAQCDQHAITEVVSGTARGADLLGERYAEERGIPLKQFPAQWRMHKLAAGHLLNKQMAEYADALIAFWDGSSPGTKSMIGLAEKRGLQVTVVYVPR